MSLLQIGVLSLIVGVFTVFALSLAGVCWYERGGAKRTGGRGRRGTGSRSGARLAWDD